MFLFTSDSTQTNEHFHPRQPFDCTLLFWKACSVVMMSSSAPPTSTEGRGRAGCRRCVSSLISVVLVVVYQPGKMTLVMPAHPSLPPSLRKPDPSSQTPTQTSAHLHIPPPTSCYRPSNSPHHYFFLTLWCFHLCSNVLFAASFWILIGTSMMMTHGALHMGGILSHSGLNRTSVLVVVSEPIQKKDEHKIDILKMQCIQFTQYSL